MDDTLLHIARGGSTDHPVISRLFMAQRVNLAHSGIVIGAWEVDDLPQDWLDALAGVVDDLPDLKKSVEAFERHRERWRAGLRGPDGKKRGMRQR